MECKKAAARFLDLLQQEAERFNTSEVMSTPDGSWTVKGFIDIFKNVYTISGDEGMPSTEAEATMKGVQ